MVVGLVIETVEPQHLDLASVHVAQRVNAYALVRHIVPVLQAEPDGALTDEYLAHMCHSITSSNCCTDYIPDAISGKPPPLDADPTIDRHSTVMPAQTGIHRAWGRSYWERGRPRPHFREQLPGNAQAHTPQTYVLY